MKLFSGAVVEVQRVNVQEKLLCVCVWIKAAEVLRYSLQTVGQGVVRSGRTMGRSVSSNCWINNRYSFYTTFKSAQVFRHSETLQLEAAAALKLAGTIW